MDEDLEHVSQWAILPARVRYDPDLPANGKLLFAEIAAKTNIYGYCFASNRWLGERLHLSQDAVSNLIKQLEQLKYIIVDVDPARENNVRRRIYITPQAFSFLPEPDKGGIGKISDTPSRKNFRDRPGNISDTPQLYENINNKTKSSGEHFCDRPKYMAVGIFQAIGEYCGDDGELMLAYLKWAEVRYKNRKPISTEETVTRANRKLDKISRGDRRYKIGMLHKATDAIWTGLFELKPGDEGYRDFESAQPAASDNGGYQRWT